MPGVFKPFNVEVAALRSLLLVKQDQGGKLRSLQARGTPSLRHFASGDAQSLATRWSCLHARSYPVLTYFGVLRPCIAGRRFGLNEWDGCDTERLRYCYERYAAHEAPLLRYTNLSLSCLVFVIHDVFRSWRHPIIIVSGRRFY